MRDIVCPRCHCPAPLYQDAKTDAATKLSPYAASDMLVRTYTGRLLRPRVQWIGKPSLAETAAAGARGRVRVTIAEAADDSGDVKRDVKGLQTIYMYRLDGVREVFAPDVDRTDADQIALTIGGGLEHLLDEYVERIEGAALCRDMLARKFNGAAIDPPSPVCADCAAPLPLMLVDETATAADLDEREIAVETAAGYRLRTTIERSRSAYINDAQVNSGAVNYQLMTRHGEGQTALTFQREPYSYLVGTWRPYMGLPRPSINTWAAEVLEEHLRASEAYVMLHEERL